MYKRQGLEYVRGKWNSRCSGEMRRYREEHQWRRRLPGTQLTLMCESQEMCIRDRFATLQAPHFDILQPILQHGDKIFAKAPPAEYRDPGNHWTGIGLIPVSYTHLDVYKRQPLSFSLATVVPRRDT